MEKIGRFLKKWFIPHSENDHRPHLLRTRTIAVVCAVAIVIEFVFLSGWSLPGFRSPLLGDIVVSTLIGGTNQARVANDLPPLEVSPLLTEVAQDKVNDMVKNDYFAHTSPSGLSPWYWFEKVGYHFSYAGENLAVDFTDSQDVTNAWLNSPEHRANILSQNFTQIGIAFATGTFGGAPAIFVAEEFGTPALMPVAATPPAAPITLRTTSVSAHVITKAALAPAVIATSASQTATSEQSFVAVKGISTETIAAVNAPASLPSPVAAAPSVPSVANVNIIQQTIANPRAAVDDLYLFLAVLFAAALILNIFIKIRIQHPDLIMGGIVAISLAGIFIVLNQHLFLSVIIR
jgi:hypothetical protein